MNEQVEFWIPVFGVGLIVVPVGLLLGYFFWINNSSDTREMRSVLFESKPYDIRSFAISADESSKARKSLVIEAITVNDSRIVTEVVDALATAVEGAPPSELKDWVAMLRVTHAKREVNVEVVCFKNDGVWLMLQSKGSSGWNLGTYHCRALGPVLERLAGYERRPVELDPQANEPEIPIPATREEK